MFYPYLLLTIACILSITAALSSANRYMAHYDLTKDGQIDSRELRTVAYMDYKLPPTISDDILRKIDRNGDKLIDRNEIIAAVTQIEKHVARATLRWLQDHDTDGDGVLDELELFEAVYMEHGLSSKNVTSCFRENDANNDGYLKASELIEALRCIRMLALKEGRQIMRIYDTDGDRRLNIREAQMLADLRYDIGPDYTARAFEDISHRSDKTINELELIDFLTELRQEAAVVALDKLSDLDRNGDEAVSFGELLQGYEKQLKKFVLKKIFSKVDVNKNAYIDPIEFVSLRNLIADEIHLQTVQDVLQQRYPVTKTTSTTATTLPPTLIIFTPRKETHNWRSARRRIRRRSDPEMNEKLTVSDGSQPGIKEVVKNDASNVQFSTAVTVVPKFMIPNEDERKFLFDGTRLLAEKLANSKKSGVGKIQAGNSAAVQGAERNSITGDDYGISRGARVPISEDYGYKPGGNEGELVTGATIDDNEYARDQNGAIINDPKIAYIKKFEKFIDFLQTTIKKVAKIVKQSKEANAERLQGFVKDINIIRRSNETTNDTAKDGTNETGRPTNLTGFPIVTTTEKIKIQKDPGEEVYGRIRNEKNLVVHTGIDSSEYETIITNRYKGNMDLRSLQLDSSPPKNERQRAKKRNYRRKNRKELKYRPDERNFRDAVEEEDDSERFVERDPDPEDSSEYQTVRTKRYKGDIRVPVTSREATAEQPKKSRRKSKKHKPYSKSTGSVTHSKRNRRKLLHKHSHKNRPAVHTSTDSSEYETTYARRYKGDIRAPASSQEIVEDRNVVQRKYKSRFLDQKHSRFDDNDDDKTAENIAEDGNNEKPAESSSQKFSGRHTESSDEISAAPASGQIFARIEKGRRTNDRGEKVHSDIDSSEFSTLSLETDGELEERKSNQKMHLEEGKSVNEFGFPVHTQMGKEIDGYRIVNSKPMYSVDERITNELGWEVHSRTPTDNFKILESLNFQPEDTRLQVKNTPTSSEEDDFFEEESEEKVDDDSISRSPETSTVPNSETSTVPTPETSIASAPKTLTTILQTDNTPTEKILARTFPAAESQKEWTKATELENVSKPTVRIFSETSGTPEVKSKHEVKAKVNETGSGSGEAEILLRNSASEMPKNETGDDVIVEAMNGTQTEMSQKKRKKCSHRRHPSQRRKCLTKRRKLQKDSRIEIVLPGTNSTDTVNEEDKLGHECQKRKKYRSKKCRKDLKSSTETHENFESSEDVSSSRDKSSVQSNRISKTNETDRSQTEERQPRTAENNDPLELALQKYQKYLENREKDVRK